jgi:hypothetical protein
MLLRLETY